MKRNRTAALVVAASLLIGACKWEIPQEVVVRATPEVWIPTGTAVFDLEFLDELIQDFTDLASDMGLEGGEKSGGGYDGRPLTLYAELDVEAPTFPDPPPGSPGFDAYFQDQIGTLDLSEVFGPLSGPVRLKLVPGLAWFERTADPEPPVWVRLRAEWTDEGTPNTQYLLGTAGGFVPLASSRAAANTFDFASIFNDQPEDLILYYEFGANTADLARIASLHISFEVPCAFETAPGTFLEVEDDDGNNPLLMEEDLFGRDPLYPDEELDRLLESIRGSNATLLLRLVNSTGLGVQLGMINTADPSLDRENSDDWVLDVEVQSDETEQEIRVEITAQVLDQLIDGAGGSKQFVPELLILLPEDFQVNSTGQFGITEGYLRVQTELDYEFSLEDEE